MQDQFQSPASDGAVARLAALQNTIAAKMRLHGRPAKELSLIAVSKTFPPSVIGPILGAGHRVFGENQLQASEKKWDALKADFPDVELHLIGALQSNKAAQAAAHFDAIHSLDRPKLAIKLADAIQNQGRHPQLFIQVNTGDEAQKAGVSVSELEGFVIACRKEYGLTISGLMCLPPIHDVPAPHFALLQKYAQDLGLSCLSMGMSADYEDALAFGATHIRLGTAIFGSRAPKD